jgi:hypothetical protein
MSRPPGQAVEDLFYLLGWKPPNTESRPAACAHAAAAASYSAAAVSGA